jgi:enoyl-CoA hydratase/carnithine racemase
MASEVLCDVRDGVATVTLNRPEKRNALNSAVLAALTTYFDELEADRDVRVVVVRGEGERAFCVGADINRFADLTPVEMLGWTERGHRVFDALAALPQPSIAVLHADAFGGGLELALACDLRVGATTARFGLPEVGLGTIPGWGGTERLVDTIGRARAKELVVARRVIDGATAERWGLATRCVPADQLEAAVAELTNTFLAGAPVAVELAKQLIDAAAEGASSRVLEPLAGAVTAATSDLAEGVAAFRARRTPAFQGH